MLRFLLRAICCPQSAVLPAIEIIEHQVQDQPDEEADPIPDRKGCHQQDARENGEDRRHWSAGSAESPRPVRFAVTKNQYASRDQSESEKRANIRKIRQRSDVQQTSGNADDEPGHPRRSEEHTSELQSHLNLVCRLLL